MKKPIYSFWLIEIIAALLIFLFVYAGISKLQEQAGFRAVISHSPLIGSIAIVLSWLLPSIELLTAILIFLPSTRFWGFLASIILMIIFTGYIEYMILFAKHLPCSCGGVLKQLSWNQHLKFNMFFLALSIAGLWLYRKNRLFIAINPGTAEASRGRQA